MMSAWAHLVEVVEVVSAEEDREDTGRRDHIEEDLARRAEVDHLPDVEGLDRHREVSTGPCVVAQRDVEGSDHHRSTADQDETALHRQHIGNRYPRKAPCTTRLGK